MPEYKAPLRDMRFLMFDVLDVVSHYAKLPNCEGLDRDMVEAIMGETAKFAENVLAPLNQPADAEGCHWSPEGVTTPKGFIEAYKQYCAAGIGGLAADAEYGGQGLPASLGIASAEFISSANTSFGMYPGLTSGAIAAISAHGTQAQKDTYLPKLIAGTWSGTMCLTEAHCGTDLGLLRTKAEPNADGTYAISGEKIFISAGDHDLTENIVHLVLARLPDAPKGTKGISLFIVPKKLLDADSNPGALNAVSCGSIEHKMGIKASATCVLNFERSTGYLVGEPHKGLKCMFTMMNVARIGTGTQGLSQAEISYQNAVKYARERLQMRALTGPKAPDKPADPIIVHPDVRRMLLTQKAFAEGSRAMAYYCGMLADISRMKGGTPEAERAESLLELLTPICKAFFTDLAHESCNLGMQVFGGHGYIREHGMEQYARDTRILQLYEGANGIQSLDLLGRKVLGTGGARLREFTDIVDAFVAEQAKVPAMAEFTEPLKPLTVEWNGLVGRIMERAIKNPDEAGAASYDFLSYSGYVVYGYLFARMAAVAQQKLAGKLDEADKRFYESKLLTARFYFQRILPRTVSLVITMNSGAPNLMDMDEGQFLA
jgi:alkylation response protein AidB-like acyl-CoA dehydrogenase